MRDGRYEDAIVRAIHAKAVRQALEVRPVVQAQLKTSCGTKEAVHQVDEVVLRSKQSTN